MNKTIQIAIRTDNEQIRERLIAHLSAIQFYAFEEQENELLSFIDEKKFDQPAFENVLGLYHLNFTKTFIEDQNWNALWESNFEPVVVDDFCAIRADFHEPFTGKKHEIIITPKMSFGTGHHATTYMMVSEMARINFINKRVADFGTGTGILAILAEKLGSEYVWAIDIDDWSIENAKENIKKNGCKNIHIERRDSFSPHEKFDIILANINKTVILSNIDDLFLWLKLRGCILVSGLLKENEDEVISAFKAKGYIHKYTVEKDKWICLLIEYMVKSDKEY